MDQMTKAQRVSFEARSMKIAARIADLAWDDGEVSIDDRVREPAVDDQEVVRTIYGSRAGVHYTVIVLGRRERS